MEYGPVIDAAVPRTPASRVGTLLSFVVVAMETSALSVGPDSLAKLRERHAELDQVWHEAPADWEHFHELEDDVIELANRIHPSWNLELDAGDVLVVPAQDEAA